MTTGHPALDEALRLVEEAREGDSNDDEIQAYREALDEALLLVPKGGTPAERMFAAAKREYHEAAGVLSATGYTLLIERAQAQWPTADKLHLLGAYGEDGELHLHVDEVWIDEDRLSAEDGNDDVETFDDANNELLMYLVETTGEDYLGTTEVDLEESA